MTHEEIQRKIKRLEQYLNSTDSATQSYEACVIGSQALRIMEVKIINEEKQVRI